MERSAVAKKDSPESVIQTYYINRLRHMMRRLSLFRHKNISYSGARINVNVFAFGKFGGHSPRFVLCYQVAIKISGNRDSFQDVYMREYGYV